jgi:hypothetical protein
MDTDVYFDIPIYKSLPKILNDNNSNLLPNIELSNIDIVKDYQLEPFLNNEKNVQKILFISLTICLFIFLLFYFF